MLSISSNEQKERVDNALRCIAQFGNTYGHFFLTSTNLLGNELFACFYYRPQTKFAKVIFYRGRGVRGTWRGGACVAGGAYMAGGACVTGGVCGRGGVCMPQQILRDMVNERAVHILLECILVLFVYFRVCVRRK